MSSNRGNNLSTCSHDPLEQEVWRESEGFHYAKIYYGAGELKLDFLNILNSSPVSLQGKL